MSLSIKLGNFLYRHAFSLYRPLYFAFKHKQDRFEIQLLKQYIQPGSVVLDIGANIGFYAQLIGQMVGKQGQVHCFEPDALNFKHLQNAIAGASNISLNQFAIGAKTETLKFYTSPNLNVDHRSYEPEVYESVTEVQAISIDDYMASHPGPVHFIKMDIQGFEMQALAGMKTCIKNNPGVCMISEFWPYGLRKAGSSATEYYRALLDLGFTLQVMEKTTLQPLSADYVARIKDLGESHYFNILATR